MEDETVAKPSKRMRGGHHQVRKQMSQTNTVQSKYAGGFSPAAFQLLEMWSWGDLSVISLAASQHVFLNTH